VPGTSPALRTGRSWRLTAGKSEAGDLIDATISVPAGQFVQNARVLSGSARSTPMEEAVGLAGPSTVGGQGVTAIIFNVGESSYTEPDPGPEPPTYTVDIPLVIR
jgi:hypothetical protein